MSEKDEGFEARREAARERLSDLPGNYAEDSAGRSVFFDSVYDVAEGDAAAVPWADLKPKQQLLDWLKENPGGGKRAVDVACGLGDNAEALAAAGYETTGFDVVETAIDWAKRRFPLSPVHYQVADLFNLNEGWTGNFHLVHECYTLQALPQEMIEQTAEAICSLVAPGGALLVYTRSRPDGSAADGPPWPLQEKNLDLPLKYGLTRVSDERFVLERGERDIPHVFMVFRK